jgi:hypothetical protein
MPNTYDPYTYNARLASFFGEGTDVHALKNAIATDPARAKKYTAVAGFSKWLQTRNPDIYNAIQSRSAHLLDPVSAVRGGGLDTAPVASASTSRGLKGLGDVTAGDDTAPSTSWGQDIIDNLSKITTAWAGVRQQQTLLDINIKRAEQGLPPIDGSAIAPAVNVGLSAQAQQLGYIAVAGLVLVGLFSMIGKKRR